MFGQLDDNSVTTTLSPVEQIFTPSVSATCRAGIMTIKVETPNQFLGVVHARDFRRPACTSYGLGTQETPLNINMLAEKNSEDYCGVFINEVRMQGDQEKNKIIRKTQIISIRIIQENYQYDHKQVLR